MYDGRGSPQIFESRDRFFAELLSPKYEGHWLYAHNGSGYDFRYLIAWLCKNGVAWEGFSAGSRIFIKAEGREFLDSMAVMPMSLDDATEQLGALNKKHKMPRDFFKRIEKYWRDGSARDYLKGDLLALWECIDILRDAVGQLGTTLKRTLASTSVDLWQRCYLEESYDVPGHRDPAEAAAREAYAGGRCEVFRRSIKRGEYWDRNSSYPAAMLDPVPVDVIATKRGETKIPDFGLVRATFDIPADEWLPPLFYRASPESRLYHPTGVWSGWRTAEEAAYVRDLYGRKSVTVHEVIAFEGRDLFGGFVRDLYEKRLTPGPVGKVAKRALNSLYGRTGMQRERERIMSGPELPDEPPCSPKCSSKTCEACRRSILSVSHCVWTVPTDSMQHNATIMPAVAATITARGRMALHRVARSAPQLAYCDTDSVVTGGRMPLESTKKLGEWKLETKLRSAEFIAPKAYRMILDDGEKVLHAKGLSSREVKRLGARYLDGKRITVGHVPGVRESMRRGQPVDSPSYAQSRQHTAGGNRHPDGRPFTKDECDQRS